jgi:hypothetical protein
MKITILIILLFPFISSAQSCSYNDSIINDPFLCTALSGGSGYWTQFSAINSDNTHYLWQERIKDSLKTKFNNEELFLLVKCKTSPFIRVAAFQALVEDDYDQEIIIKFFEDDFTKKTDFSFGVPVSVGIMPYTQNGFNRLVYIKEIMFSMIDPTKKEYLKCEKLDLETAIYLKSIFPYSIYIGGAHLLDETQKKNFIIYRTDMDFGAIDLNLYNGLNENITLKSKLRITNLSDNTITITVKTDSHTYCDQQSYQIMPKDEEIIDFKCLVNSNRKSGPINRQITFSEHLTGQAIIYNINAEIIQAIE